MFSITNIKRLLFAFALCFLALAGPAKSSKAQIQTTINVDFLPHQSGYRRGTTVLLKAHLQTWYGCPLYNMQVSFHMSANGGSLRLPIGTACTDCFGDAYFNYTVPGVGVNNVDILSQFNGAGSFCYSDSGWNHRLPIGGP